MKNHRLMVLCAVLFVGSAVAANSDDSGEPRSAVEPEAIVDPSVAAAPEPLAAPEIPTDPEALADLEVPADAEVVAAAEVPQAVVTSKLICKREKPIGSKRIKKTCYTREQLDEQTRDTQDAMMRNQRNTGCVDCGGGN